MALHLTNSPHAHPSAISALSAAGAIVPIARDWRRWLLEDAQPLCRRPVPDETGRVTEPGRHFVPGWLLLQAREAAPDRALAFAERAERAGVDDARAMGARRCS
jgi:mannose/cellobiose epimerase-like protein (N-acyl-D-glucosamine 2-epimerase family)